MRIVITGSSGYLGKALVQKFRQDKHDVIGIDILESDETTVLVKFCEIFNQCYQTQASK